MMINLINSLQHTSCFRILQDHFLFKERCSLGAEGVLLVALERGLGEEVALGAEVLLGRLVVGEVDHGSAVSGGDHLLLSLCSSSRCLIISHSSTSSNSNTVFRAF